MANIDGGSLSFRSLLDNGQFDEAIQESLKRVQGLSDATVSGGKKMDKAFLQTADGIRQAIGQIGQACEMHERALSELEAKYNQLGKEAQDALGAGRMDEARRAKDMQAAIAGEMAVRKQALAEARELSDVLEEEAQKRERLTTGIKRNETAQQSLRGRIKELKEEMALLIEQGIDQQSASYKALVNELGRLQDIQGDIATQGKILANDEAKFQGFIQGISGLAGGLSAATGAVSLFAGENENLQKVMTKVQSVMAIAIGMQQVAQTLNKDSAFQLVTLNGLKSWWAGVVAKATVAETANTAATAANTAAKEAQAAATAQNAVAQGANTAATTAQTVAATAGTTANLGFAGSLRLVGVALKSIPVFGWVLAGISALIGLVVHFSSKAREAKKAQEEFSNAMIEGAYKPIGKIEELSAKYTALGNNIKDKEQFVKDNKKAFEELGVSITSVRDAENLLISNKEAFIEAQMAKARALVHSQQATEKIKEKMKLQAEYEAMSDTKRKSFFLDGGNYTSITVENEEKKRKKREIEALDKEIRKGYENAAKEEAAVIEKMKKSGVNATKEYAKGTVGAIEQAISEKREALKDLVPNSAEWKATHKEIEELQKKLAQPGKSESSSKKDPFVEMLDKRKAEYQRFLSWVNSGDKVLAKSSETEFKGLLAQGATYIDYLKKQRDIIQSVDAEKRTKEQNKQLRTLNDQIAEETKKTVLERFNTELSDQLNNAKTTLEILNIIEKKREGLANDGTELDNEKKQALADAEKGALQRQREETQKLLEDYASYLDRKIALDLRYSNDLALLEKARAKATTDEERKKIDAAIANRKEKHKKDGKLSGDPEYDQMLQTYKSFEEKMTAIAEEFTEKRKKAQEHGNTEMIAQLDKAEQQLKSKLALKELQESPDWEKLFGNLDEVGTKELEKLLELIEGKTVFLGVEFDPKDLDVIKGKIKELKNEIRERNPFGALKQGFEDFRKAATEGDKMAALAGMMDSATKAGSQVKGILTDIMGTLDSLGVEGLDEVGFALQAVEGFASGAQDAIMGIASGNPVQAVAGAVKAIGSVVSYFAGANDRRAEKAIKMHQENVEKLTSLYKQLEWQISKAFSTEKYKHQHDAIKNMKQQQKELAAMIQAEKSKKKTDSDKIKEWEERIKDINRAIADMIEEMKNDLLGSDAKSIASELGDALTDAFENGKNAAHAWGDTVKNIINNLVKNMIIQKVLYDPIKNIIDKYTSKWVDKDGNFAGLDAVIGDIDNLNDELTGLYPQLEGALNALKDKLNLSLSPDSLSGAVKGVTEETAGIVAGQLNAMRINQAEASEILRQQLAVLSTIAQNTAYNKLLVNIYRELKGINISSSTSPLRAKGLL
ncbi:hypothetical protein HMPREF1990_00443 [Porphyromonas gingivalis W4087]|uniref:hypothetical protein n=2 Tax=Porphyromonas gingivalis TaxID=837 RepID=UPI0003AD7128|nr:hypothetical protein [Porphyromonas gingivalis]ERJ90821.1 hypothetical protein HMPREF1990_00443 [Porphyromonas gingivalis W4087]PDP62316.1 hypothetical protein CLI83_06195 [Porphyromonas gingivalis]PDP75544.1 hypothetical protein CLI79_03470 [Porphyromonas gingivalis]